MVNRVASVNEGGLVFSRVLGKSDFKRYHWGEFSLNGTQTLIAELPGQSVFRQKSRADQSRFMDALRNQMLKLMPPPAVEDVEPPPAIALQPPRKPITQPISPPEPAPVLVPPPAVNRPEKEVRSALSQDDHAKPAAAVESPITSTVPNQDSPRESGSQALSTEPFRLIPGPNILPPDTELAEGASTGLWFIAVLVVSLSAWAGREVAVFRNRPVGLVCLLSALFPVIVPVVFLILPEPGDEIEERQLPAYTPAPDVANIEDATHITELDTRMESEVEPSAQVHECYRASETRFSGKFFADYLARFYKEPPEDGRALVLTTEEGAYPVHHISDLSQESMTIVYPSQEGLAETSIPYRHLQEVRVQTAQIL